MDFQTNALVCRQCGREYSPDEPIWRCFCGGLLDIIFKVEFPLEKIKQRKPSIWRYREAIPINEDKNIITFDEGFTPLIEVNFLGLPILFKLDYLFPSGSFKDRGASVLISKVKELGLKSVIEDSSGNAGSAISIYCAVAGINCQIFVPANASREKLAQIKASGAKLVKVKGDRTETARVAMQFAEKTYYASHSFNPFFFQGTKTIAYEICEQLNWIAPNKIYLPVGNGTLLLGVYIGFTDLFKAGVIRKLPKIIAVQAKACAPVFKAFKKNLSELPQIKLSMTIAEGIAISKPVRYQQIIEAIKATHGDILTVDEYEIKEALTILHRKGLYVEPTSAVAAAGLKKDLQKLSDSEIIICCLTGTGLKSSKVWK